MNNVDQWLKEQEKNYPTIEELKQYKTEVLLKWWLNCWGWKDPQEYQDMDWCWEKQISYFLEDPIIQTQRAIKENPMVCACCGEDKPDYIEALEKDCEEYERKQKDEKKNKTSPRLNS